MREKNQLFAGFTIIAFAANIISVISTKVLVVEHGLWIEGNPIYRTIFAISPWIAFITPFVTLGVLYKVYRWNGNGGLVLAGVWFGVSSSDLIMHIFSWTL